MKALQPALGLLLLTCSAGAREASPVLDYQDRYFYDAPLGDFFVPGPDKDAPKRWVTSRLGSSLRPSFLDQKEAGVKRVFLVGGSVVQLFQTEYLERALKKAFPDYRFELINCGMTAYESHLDLLSVEEIAGHSPDLIIVMSGVNEGERRETDPFRLRSIKALLKGAAQGRPGRAARIIRPHLSAASPEGLIQTFSENILDMARTAKKAGVPILFAALPWNMRDMPPKGRFPLGEKAFFDAWYLYESGDYPSAARGFARFVAELPQGETSSRNYGRFYQARALDEAGKYEDAYQAYRNALSEQIPPILRLNETLRRLVAKEGLILADVEGVFRTAAPHGLMGSELFEDDMHWDRSYDTLAAEELARAIGASGIWGQGKSPSGMDGPAPADAGERSKKATAWTVFAVRVWNAGHFDAHRFADRLTALLENVRRIHPELLASGDAVKLWLKENLKDNIWDKNADKSFADWWPLLEGHIGEVYLRNQEFDRAFAYLDKARADTKDHVYIRLRRAVALSFLGREKESKEAFAEIGPREKDFPEIGYYRKRLAGQKGREPRASLTQGAPSPDEIIKEAEEIRLGETLTPLESARIYIGRKRPAWALESLRKLEQWTLDPFEILEAARLYAQLGQGERSLALARRLTDGPTDALPAEQWLLLAESATAAGGEPTARAALARVGKGSLKPEDRARLALVHQALKDFGEAIGIYEELIVLDPGNGAYHADRGVLRAMQGDKEKAVRDLKKALELEPRAWGAGLTLGGLLSDMGQKQEALALYDALIRSAGDKTDDPVFKLILAERERGAMGGGPISK